VFITYCGWGVGVKRQQHPFPQKSGTEFKNADISGGLSLVDFPLKIEKAYRP